MSERFPILEHVSYSSLNDLEYCPKYFELMDLKKIVDKQNTPETSYGTLLHKYIQLVLQDKIEVKKAIDKFGKTWDRYCSTYKIDNKYKPLTSVGQKVIPFIKGFLIKHFGQFEVLHVEYKIYNKIENFNQSYKGFIDLIIKLKNNKIIILDIKTAKSIFNFKSFRDKIKDYQVTLYKKFYSDIEKIDLDNIETYFLVIEKNPDAKTPLCLIEVGSSNTKINNATNWLNNSLRIINNEKFIKKRTSCRKFGDNYVCKFYKSEHCT